MRHAIVVLLLVTPAAPAQNRPVTFEVVSPTSSPTPVAAPATGPDEDWVPGWLSAEALLWWTRSQPVPPLVTATTGNRTSLALGNNQVNSDALPGGRLSAGVWLDDGQLTAVQAGYFFLNNQSANQSADTSGTPQLSVPYFNIATGLPSTIAISTPGTVFVKATSDGLRGANLLLRRMVYREGDQRLLSGLRVDVMGGYNFFNLQEDLSIRATLPPNVTRGPTRTALDVFGTRNEFQGAQVGAVAALERGRLTAEAQVALALGATAQTALVEGATMGTRTVPGGLYAQPANSGLHRRSEFSVVPQVELKVGWQLNPWLRMTLAYNALVWTGVVRPGDQINPAINPNAINPARTAVPFSFHDSDAWAQGLSFGLEVAY
jgi:hypothetical protein